MFSKVIFERLDSIEIAVDYPQNKVKNYIAIPFKVMKALNIAPKDEVYVVNESKFKYIKVRVWPTRKEDDDKFIIRLSSELASVLEVEFDKDILVLTKEKQPEVPSLEYVLLAPEDPVEIELKLDEIKEFLIGKTISEGQVFTYDKHRLRIIMLKPPVGKGQIIENTKIELVKPS